MKIKFLALTLGSVALLNLSACSTIKSWFPDKEKDYQYTTEIPELHVPDDLEGNARIEVASDDTPPSPPETEEKPRPETKIEESDSGVVVPPRQAFLTETPSFLSAKSESAPAETATQPDAALSAEADKAGATDGTEEPAIDLKKVSVESVKFTSNDNHFLRIGLPLRRTWNVVGKALSRNSIEIIHRNQEESLFTVEYDPDEKTLADETIMDEINFLFDGLKHNEQELSLKLIESNHQTDVVIVDKNQQPLPDSAGLKLLDLIQKTIQADLAK